MTNEIRHLQLGSCPDSWGVWFADDPRQTPWARFLDELAAAGYRWLELGPYFAAVLAETRKVAELTRALGAKNLIFVPVPGYRDDVTGAYHEPAELSPDRWQALIDNSNTLGKVLAEEYGLRMQFHPHADYHVETQAQTERFLEETDPAFVSLCLDTGHLAYRRADVPAIIRKYPDRIGYVHIKQMPFGQAVAQGASVEPPAGLPDVPSVVEALSSLSAELFVVVEQDMYPVDFDLPLPIATRTRQYLDSVLKGTS